jgi:hypothetical protein
MTEAEWNDCVEPDKMLAFLRDGGFAGERLCRLFACACVRRVWHLLVDEGSRKWYAITGRTCVLSGNREA